MWVHSSSVLLGACLLPLIWKLRNPLLGIRKFFLDNFLFSVLYVYVWISLTFFKDHLHFPFFSPHFFSLSGEVFNFIISFFYWVFLFTVVFFVSESSVTYYLGKASCSYFMITNIIMFFHCSEEIYVFTFKLFFSLICSLYMCVFILITIFWVTGFL